MFPMVSKDMDQALVQLFIGSMVGFFVFFYGTDQLLKNILKPKMFVDMTRKDQADFLSRITAQLHAIISTYFGYCLIFDYCQSGKPIYQDY